jgi:hypothetical protein
MLIVAIWLYALFSLKGLEIFFDRFIGIVLGKSTMEGSFAHF